MKYITLLICACIFSLSTFAQSRDEKAVTDAVNKLKKAMIDSDMASLSAVASEKLSYGHSGGAVEDKAAFVEKIASGKSDFVTIDLSEQTITIADDVAIVRHNLNATTNDNSTPGTVKLKVLLVWYKEKGEWKLIARQAVKLS